MPHKQAFANLPPMPPTLSRWRKPQTWHALVLAAVQIGGLTLFGWSALSLWLVFLWDDLCLAMSSWVRTAWARTKAGAHARTRRNPVRSAGNGYFMVG